MGKGSQHPGVKPMSISGHFNRERDRLLGMTEEDRAFRAQWLKDQVLSPNEPRHVPEMYKATHNPIKRFYRWPLDQMHKAIAPIFGEPRAGNIRYMTGKIGLVIVGAYMLTYYVKYNGNDWTRHSGLKVMRSRTAVVEGDSEYPKLSDRNKPADYATRGFEKCNLNL